MARKTSPMQAPAVAALEVGVQPENHRFEAPSLRKKEKSALGGDEEGRNVRGRERCAHTARRRRVVHVHVCSHQLIGGRTEKTSSSS